MNFLIIPPNPTLESCKILDPTATTGLSVRHAYLRMRSFFGTRQAWQALWWTFWSLGGATLFTRPSREHEDLKRASINRSDPEPPWDPREKLDPISTDGWSVPTCIPPNAFFFLRKAWKAPWWTFWSLGGATLFRRPSVEQGIFNMDLETDTVPEPIWNRGKTYNLFPKLNCWCDMHTPVFRSIPRKILDPTATIGLSVRHAYLRIRLFFLGARGKCLWWTFWSLGGATLFRRPSREHEELKRALTGDTAPWPPWILQKKTRSHFHNCTVGPDMHTSKCRSSFSEEGLKGSYANKFSHREVLQSSDAPEWNTGFQNESWEQHGPKTTLNFVKT